MEASQSAFLKAIQRHEKIINSLCAVYYATKEDQKDAQQDIVLQLWKAWPQFRQQSGISTWIYRIGLNTLLNKRRNEAKRPVGSVTSSLSDHEIYPLIPADDDFQVLKQVINLLDHLEKALVVLYLEGYKYNEIGEMLNLSPTNVSTRMMRIKKKLKQYHSKLENATG